MHVFYLHGFASSARSSKASFFAGRLRARGIELHTPDFNEPDFSGLTVTRMVEQVGAAIDALPPGPVTLIGSSLGGFVAVQTALARPARIDKLVLLAPALDLRGFGESNLAEWRRSGKLLVFHYGYGRIMDVGYALYDDAQRYDALQASLPMPVQVFMGRRDETVDPLMVEQWARARKNVELHMLDDGHQLGESLETIWKEVERFLGLNSQSPTSNSQ